MIWLTSVGHTGESRLAGEAYIGESRLLDVGYTGESRLTGVAYTGEVPLWLNNIAKIRQNLKSSYVEYLLQDQKDMVDEKN